MNIFICVNYNSSRETINYVGSIIELSDWFESRIIIVDNFSEKEEVDILSEYLYSLSDNKIKLILAKANLGYFGGLNIGIEYGLKNFGFDNYFIVGNNDIKFDIDFLKELKKIRISDDLLVLAPDIVTKNGIHENPHVINKISLLRKLAYRIYYTNFFVAKLIHMFYSPKRKPKAFVNESMDIRMGIGALYILTPVFFRYFSALWDKVFLYGEEAILAKQIRSVKGRIRYIHTLKCYHNESYTTSKLPARKKYEIMRKSYFTYNKYL